MKEKYEILCLEHWDWYNSDPFVHIACGTVFKSSATDPTSPTYHRFCKVIDNASNQLNNYIFGDGTADQSLRVGVTKISSRPSLVLGDAAQSFSCEEYVESDGKTQGFFSLSFFDVSNSAEESDTATLN